MNYLVHVDELNQGPVLTIPLISSCEIPGITEAFVKLNHGKIIITRGCRFILLLFQCFITVMHTSSKLSSLKVLKVLHVTIVSVFNISFILFSKLPRLTNCNVSIITFIMLPLLFQWNFRVHNLEFKKTQVGPCVAIRRALSTQYYFHDFRSTTTSFL